MLVSQQKTSQASQSLTKQKNGSQLDQGFLHHLEKAQEHTHLFAVRNPLAEFDYGLLHIRPSMPRQGKTDSQLTNSLITSS